MRQKKYLATKDLLKKVSGIEKKIETLELRQKELEKMLADPSVYSNPQEVKERNHEYQEIKNKLDLTINEWEKHSEELHRIEKQFN